VGSIRPILPARRLRSSHVERKSEDLRDAQMHGSCQLMVGEGQKEA